MSLFLYASIFVIGLILIGIAVMQCKKMKKFLAIGIKTEAIVIKLEPVRHTKGLSYRPILQYTDQTGRITTFQHKVGANPPAYKIGEKVEIIYNPNERREAKVISYWNLFLGIILLLIFASPCLIIGGGYLIYFSIIK